MKTSFFNLAEAQQLTSGEMLNIRGGRMVYGPGDTVADDIDMPDITLSALRQYGRTGRTIRNQFFF